MFLVLIVHADYFALGSPSQVDTEQQPVNAITRIFFEAISIGCVDIFILISGWFGIKQNLKGFLNFIFQCLFFLIGIYIICLIFNIAEFNIKGIMGCFAMLKWNWFIKAYLGLYIISPILNTFVEHVSRKKFRNFIIFFFIFQTLYGHITSSAVFFEHGYSTISFIGLYMLARFAKLYPNRMTTLNKKNDLLIIISIIIFLTIIEFFARNNRINIITELNFNYINPLVIILSLYTLILFSKLSFQNNTINWIATSSFAVFLLHTNPNLCRQYFITHVNYMYSHYNGIICLGLILSYLYFCFSHIY